MRKLVLYGVILFQVIMIVSLVRGIQLSKRSATRISQMKELKIKLEEERDKLIAEGEYVKSQFYLEKVAREELHLAKPGETIVIVPEGTEVISDKGQVKSETQNEKPNWLKWWEVLLGRD